MPELKLLPGILYTLLSSCLANLCSLCSGVSSAVALAHRSLSSSLRLPTSAFFVFLLDPSLSCCPTSLTPVYKVVWLAHTRDQRCCVHGPKARLQKITTDITALGLTQARPTNYRKGLALSGTASLPAAVYLLLCHIMYMTKSPRPSPSVCAYCK